MPSIVLKWVRTFPLGSSSQIPSAQASCRIFDVNGEDRWQVFQLEHHSVLQSGFITCIVML